MSTFTNIQKNNSTPTNTSKNSAVITNVSKGLGQANAGLAIGLLLALTYAGGELVTSGDAIFTNLTKN